MNLQSLSKKISYFSPVIQNTLHYLWEASSGISKLECHPSSSIIDLNHTDDSISTFQTQHNSLTTGRSSQISQEECILALFHLHTDWQLFLIHGISRKFCKALNNSANNMLWGMWKYKSNQPPPGPSYQNHHSLFHCHIWQYDPWFLVFGPICYLKTLSLPKPLFCCVQRAGLRCIIYILHLC